MMNKQIETDQCGLFKLQQTVFHPLCGVAGAGDAHVRSATHRLHTHFRDHKAASCMICVFNLKLLSECVSTFPDGALCKVRTSHAVV